MADHPRGRAPIVRAVAVRAETPRLRWRRIGTRAGGAICFVPPRRCATHGQTPRRSGRKNRWDARWRDRKSTRLNSSHTVISYAVFCLKKKDKMKGLPRIFFRLTSGVEACLLNAFAVYVRC